MALCGLALAVACANFGVQAGDGVVLTPGRTEVLIAPDAPKTLDELLAKKEKELMAV